MSIISLLIISLVAVARVDGREAVIRENRDIVAVPVLHG